MKHMYKTYLSVAALVAVAACSGSGSNPLTGSQAGLVGAIDTTDPNQTAAQRFAFDPDVGLVMNSLSYDPDTDELVINNLPFDTTTGIYENTTRGDFAANGRGWALYEPDERDETGRQRYVSVFKQTSTGNAFASAVGTGDDFGEGNGGLTAQRVAGPAPSLPTTGLVFYTGDYAGVQTLIGPGGSDTDTRLTTGTAEISIDFDDFDVTGDIIGRVIDREVYDNEGNLIGSLAAVGLGEGVINRGNATIDGELAGSTDGTLSGTWRGVFAGPEGEEIAAYVVLGGFLDTDNDPQTPGVGAREYGAIIVERADP